MGICADSSSNNDNNNNNKGDQVGKAVAIIVGSVAGLAVLVVALSVCRKATGTFSLFFFFFTPVFSSLIFLKFKNPKTPPYFLFVFQFTPFL